MIKKFDFLWLEASEAVFQVIRLYEAEKTVFAECQNILVDYKVTIDIQTDAYKVLTKEQVQQYTDRELKAYRYFVSDKEGNALLDGKISSSNYAKALDQLKMGLNYDIASGKYKASNVRLIWMNKTPSRYIV